MVFQMLNKNMPFHGSIFRQKVPSVNSDKNSSRQHGVGAVLRDMVLFFRFQQIQYSIEVSWALVWGIPPEAGKSGEGKRLSNFTQSLSKID
jgi:hypothetical protein